MTVANTSRNHFKTYDAGSWYSRILDLMRDTPNEAFCISDIARALQAEKSSVSARMKELFDLDEIEIAGEYPSRSTSVKSKHYQLKVKVKPVSHLDASDPKCKKAGTHSFGPTPDPRYVKCFNCPFTKKV